MIIRSNPDVGYLSGEVFEVYAFTRTIRAGDTLYLSSYSIEKGGVHDLA